MFPSIVPYGDPDWWKAKKIIEQFLAEISAYTPIPEQLDRDSSVLIARLSHENLFIVRASMIKEDDE